MEKAGKRRIVVLGAGAVGSVVAAALAAKGESEVRLVGRRAQVEAVQRRGLTVHGMFPGPVRLEASEKIDVPLDHALLVVTVKAGDLQAALRPIAPQLRPTTSLLLLQNGWGIRELALEALAASAVRGDRVFVGIVGLGATLLAPGEARCFGGNIRCDPGLADSPFFALLQGLPLRVERSRDIRRDMWTKLLINAVINPLSVLLQGHNRLVAETRFDRLKSPILSEGRAVAAAEGTPVAVDAAFVNRFVASDNISSMLQDVRRGRPTEIDFINGAIVRLGASHGVPTPVNAFVVDLVHALEERRCARDEAG